MEQWTLKHCGKCSIVRISFSSHELRNENNMLIAMRLTG